MTGPPTLPRSLNQSVFARLTLGFVVLALVSFAAMIFAAQYTVASARDEAVQRLVDNDLAGLADIYASGGFKELSARIRDRIALPPSATDPAHYLVADAQGHPLAGNIHQWPALGAQSSQSAFIIVNGDIPVFARATQLAPDVRIVVAHEYGSWNRLAARVRLALLIVTGIMLLLIIAAGTRAAQRLRGRTMALIGAFRQFEAGDHDARVPDDDRIDEIATIAAHSNQMFARINTVITAHRDISDHVAHEMRTPLMHLDNRLLTLMETADRATVETALAPARGDIRNTLRMLDSLLDISASEAQRGDAAGLTELNLSELVANLADLYAETADDMGWQFTTNIAPDVMIAGDAMQLSRLVSNLLDNAFKFAPENGGEISITLSAGPVINVCDNGPGVPPDMRERIFDRFQRASGNGTNGHGLGLALARAIAGRHGLSIRVEDGVPGARFIVSPEVREA